MKVIPPHTAIDIRRWLKENYHNSFTVDQVNNIFKTDLTDKTLCNLYEGRFTINLPLFTFYRKPVSNTAPYSNINLIQLFQAITGDYYKRTTMHYRQTKESSYKAKNFDHVTISGIFNKRSKEGLEQRSGYAVFDFDHVPDPEKVKQLLIHDEKLTPELVFTSPSGDGVKAVLYDSDMATHEMFYKLVTSYIERKYPEIYPFMDAKTKDIARTCFLCYDPQAYIKPQYLELWQAQRN